MLIFLDKEEEAYKMSIEHTPWLALPLKDSSCHKLISYFEFRQQIAGKNVLLGVEDMDIFKMINLKVLAMEQMLIQHPKWQGRAVMMQIANPVRRRGRDLEEIEAEIRSSCKRIFKKLHSPNAEGSDSIRKQKVINSVSGTCNDNQSPSTEKHAFSNVKSSVVDNVNRVPADSSEISDSSPNASTVLKTSVRKVVHQFKVYKLLKHNTMGLGNESTEATWEEFVLIRQQFHFQSFTLRTR